MTNKQTNKKSFLLHFDQRGTFKKLSPKYCKELILAIFDFAQGQKPALSPYLEVVFIPFEEKLKREIKKWDELSKLRSEYGKKGGIAKASKSYQEPALLSKSAVSVSVSVNNRQAIDEIVKLLGNRVVVKKGKLYSVTKTGEKLIKHPEAYLATLKEKKQVSSNTGGSVFDQYVRNMNQ